MSKYRMSIDSLDAAIRLAETNKVQASQDELAKLHATRRMLIQLQIVETNDEIHHLIKMTEWGLI